MTGGYNTKHAYFPLLNVAEVVCKKPSFGDVSTSKFEMTETMFANLLPDLDGLTNSMCVAMKASDWPTGHLRRSQCLLISRHAPEFSVKLGIPYGKVAVLTRENLRTTIARGVQIVEIQSYFTYSAT